MWRRRSHRLYWSRVQGRSTRWLFGLGVRRDLSSGLGGKADPGLLALGFGWGLGGLGLLGEDEEFGSAVAGEGGFVVAVHGGHFASVADGVKAAGSDSLADEELADGVGSALA